jgi:hypothetical protein
VAALEAGGTGDSAPDGAEVVRRDNLSRYLGYADYYWEVVVDGRDPREGYRIFFEERRTGTRHFHRAAKTEREMTCICRTLQRDLCLPEEEFEGKYSLRLSAPTQEAVPAAAAQTA